MLKTLRTEPKLLETVAWVSSLYDTELDASGSPQINHLLAVYRFVMAEGGDLDTCHAALLHDAVEDKKTTLEELADRGYTDLTVAIVDVVSRRENETYAEFIERVAASRTDPVLEGRPVLLKLGDLYNNNDPTRMGTLAMVNPAKAKSLSKRYMKAIARLSAPA